MSAQTIYDTAPLGALIRTSDGKTKPPARFTKKLAAWERNNATGRLIRKSPPFTRGTYTAAATITLHEGDYSSHGVKVLTVHRTHDVNSALHFEVVAVPKAGSCRILQSYGETVELLHLADDQAAAEAWLQSNRYSGARIERVGDIGEEFAGKFSDARALPLPTRETA